MIPWLTQALTRLWKCGLFIHVLHQPYRGHRPHATTERSSEEPAPASTLLSTDLQHLLRELWRTLQTPEGKGGTETASPGRGPPLRLSHSLDQGVRTKHVFTSMLISLPLVATSALKMYRAVSMTTTLRPSHLRPRLYQPQLCPNEVCHVRG